MNQISNRLRRFLLNEQFVVIVNGTLYICSDQLDHLDVVFKRVFVGIAFWGVVVQYVVEPEILNT